MAEDPKYSEDNLPDAVFLHLEGAPDFCITKNTPSEAIMLVLATWPRDKPFTASDKIRKN